MRRSERWALARGASSLLGELRSEMDDFGTSEEKEMVEAVHRLSCTVTKLFELPEEQIGKKGESFS